MGAFTLEAGGLANVTAVLRSNYAAVSANGFNITSLDHGNHKGWKPTAGKVLQLILLHLADHVQVVNAVPSVAQENLPPFDFIVVATKNCPDISPTVSEIIAPAVTEGHSVIVLVQNGLNIEKPLIAAFPKNIILSGVSLIGVAEKGYGEIIHDDHDELIIGPFQNPGVSQEAAVAAAKKFVEIYSASGKVDCPFNEDVAFVRWRKLVYNACFNPITAITRMDTSRMRVFKTPIDDLVRPAMWEIYNTAKAAGVTLPEDIVERTINIDPFEVWCKPSMCQDAQKVGLICSLLPRSHFQIDQLTFEFNFRATILSI